VCDTLCLLHAGGSLFAKNSDRPVDERQLLRAYPARDPGGELDTQYLTIRDAGAIPAVLSQPVWLWGAEHGVNACHVAIGNEKVYGVADPYEAAPGLIGMDLVRLGLERGRTAVEAVDVMTDLLERHGQGGVADATSGEPYWSSFLVVDPQSGFVLETCGRTWAAKRVHSSVAISNRMTIRQDWERASRDVPAGADFDGWRNPDAPTGHADKRLGASVAISNRMTIRQDWERASRDVPAGADFDGWRNPDAPTGHADIRLGASVAFLEAAGGSNMPLAAAAVGHLRDHGSGPWGAPGSSGRVVDPPGAAFPDGTGVTVCMHVRRFMSTTSSLVAELPDDPGEPATVWAALGSPCASVYLPFFVPPSWRHEAAPIPAALGDEAIADRLAVLRHEVENGPPGTLARLRSGLDGLEESLWEDASVTAGDPTAWESNAERASARLLDALGAA
jgi:secernin